MGWARGPADVHLMSAAPDRRIRVAVVDDEPDLALVIAVWVRLDPRLTLVGVGYDGFEALQLVRNARPDVLVLDVNMPRLDGIETLARIRGCGFQTPVIIYSARPSDQRRLDGLTPDDATYVQKVGTRGELLEAVVERATAGAHVPGEAPVHLS